MLKTFLLTFLLVFASFRQSLYCQCLEYFQAKTNGNKTFYLQRKESIVKLVFFKKDRFVVRIQDSHFNLFIGNGKVVIINDTIVLAYDSVYWTNKKGRKEKNYRFIYFEDTFLLQKDGILCTLTKIPFRRRRNR